MGIGDDPSSARAHDRARRRALARWRAMGRGARQLPRPCQRAGAPVPRQDAGDAHGCAPRRPIEVLQYPGRSSPTSARSSASSLRCVGSSGWSTARRRSRDPSRCCAICRATPIALPSRTVGSLLLMMAACHFRWKDYRIKGPGRWKTMTASHRTSLSAASSSTCYRKASIASATTGCSPTANRADSIAKARELLAVAQSACRGRKRSRVAPSAPRALPRPCPRCGAA